MENQILLEWCKSLLEKQNISIYNFRRGLKDGIKLAIIINEVLEICGNDSRIDIDDLDKSDITKNYRIIQNMLEDEFEIEFNLDPQSISAKEEDFNPIIQDLMRIYEKNKDKGGSDEENENRNVEIENSEDKGEETKSIKKHKKIKKRKTRSRRDISMSFHENSTPSLERNISPRKEATSPREVKFNVNEENESNKPKEKLSSLGINKKKGTKTDKTVLEKEIERLKGKIKEMEKTMEEKTQIWSDSNKEKEEISKKAETKFNNLNLEFNVLKKNNQQLIEENKNLEKLKETAKDEYSELRESYTHLENEHKALSKKYKKETEKNESLKEVLGERDHEDELEDLRDEIDQKEYALSESLEKYEKLTNQFENQKKLIEKLEGQIKDSKIEYNRMNDENSMLRSVIDSQKHGLEKANIENNNYHKLLEEEKKKVESLLNNERRSSEDSGQKKISTNSRKSSSVFPEVTKKTEEGQVNIIAENELLKEEIEKLKEVIQEIEESKDDNSQLKELIELKEQISSLRKKHERVLDNLSELKLEKEKSDLEMKNVKAEFEECQDENEKLCENIDNLKLEISVFQLNNEKLSETLDRDTKKITLLEKKLHEANKTESQQKMQLESLSKIVHQLRNNQQLVHSTDQPKIEENHKTLSDDSEQEPKDKIPKYLMGSVDFDDEKPNKVVPPLNLSLNNKSPPQVSFDMESEDLTIDINSKIDKDSPKKEISPSRKSEGSPRKKIESPRRHRSPRKKSPRKKKRSTNGELKVDHRDDFLLSVPEEMKDETYKILENCYISLKLELETLKEMVKKNGPMHKHDLEKNLNSSKNVQESQKKKILKLESSLTQKEKEIKHSEEVIEKQNERYKELLTKHNDLSKEIVSLRISIQNGPNPVETSDEMESQLINSLKSQLEGNISQSKQKVTEITLNYTDVIDKLKSENEKLQEDLNKATNDVNVLELQLESHKTSAKNNQKKMSLEFNAAMKELAITKKVNSKLKKKVDYLQMSSLEEKNTFEQQLVSFKKKYLEIQQKYAKQLKLYSNIQSKLSSNMTEITKNGEYKDLILDKDQENNNLKKQLELVTNQLENYNQKEIYNNLTHLNDPKSYYTHEEVIQRNRYPNDNRAFTHQVTKKIDSGYEQEQLYNVVYDMFTLFKKNFQGFSKNSQHYTCELSIRRAK